VIPASTVLLQEGTNIRYIYVNRDNVAKRIEVVPGKRFDDKVEVISQELKEGDLLISEGQSRLIDGDRIEIIK
jgi:multidrug efflux pump subunit AcrA (membrane-fusion protein)